MSWSELERFVADVEADRALQRAIEEERQEQRGDQPVAPDEATALTGGWDGARERL
ncbi:putative nif11-like leader peptide domain protein [Synechococcus sp. RS9909]|uniref:hypothetical protein n=1 Tax=unclassified Synechococcus TaxID=2626047 RepID=UPI0000690DDE|nr:MULTISPECIES: hypothetical protein [unclassified Synechococcus]EAQ68791.1 hypothetical protein RS9917_00487 [Synechococcus sp. RS9917]QNI79065.1 putative nif11-like leader peptide domain protein [Synechococcus sp. RS9909]